MRINKAGGGIGVYREVVLNSGKEERTFELRCTLKITCKNCPFVYEDTRDVVQVLLTRTVS